MKKFRNIAQVIRRKRIDLNMSQTKMASMIGYKNGQYISNVERSLCSIPNHDVLIISKILNVDRNLLIEAMTMDYKEHLLNVTSNEVQNA